MTKEPEPSAAAIAAVHDEMLGLSDCLAAGVCKGLPCDCAATIAAAQVAERAREPDEATIERAIREVVACADYIECKWPACSCGKNYLPKFRAALAAMGSVPDRDAVALNLEHALSRIADYQRRITAVVRERQKWDPEAWDKYLYGEIEKLASWFLEQGIALEGFKSSPHEKVTAPTPPAAERAIISVCPHPEKCERLAYEAELNSGRRFWLWRNRNEQFGDHWLAFDTEFPTIDGGDPAVLGEPQYSIVAAERATPAASDLERAAAILMESPYDRSYADGEWLTRHIATALAEARREAESAMRERAAQEVVRLSFSAPITSRELAAAIRSLPLTPDGTPAEGETHG